MPNLIALAIPNPVEALKVFYKSPAWRAPWFPDPALPPVELRSQQHKYDPQVSPRARQWALAQFTLLVFVTFSLLMWGGALPWTVKLGAASLSYLTLINIAALLEGRR